MLGHLPGGRQQTLCLRELAGQTNNTDDIIQDGNELSSGTYKISTQIFLSDWPLLIFLQFHYPSVAYTHICK